MKTLLVIFLFALPLGAQELPNKPQPTADREFWTDTAALGTGWTFDTVTSHEILKRPGSYEGGLLFTGSSSTVEVMGAWAGIDLATIAISYEWKKHVHNRYLHPLWRVPLFIGAIGHTNAAIGNWRRF